MITAMEPPGIGTRRIMRITALVCNSVYVQESVIREGEEKELLIEGKLFMLKEQAGLKLVSKEEGLRIRFLYGIRSAEGFPQEIEPVLYTDGLILLKTISGESLYLSVFFSGEEGISRYGCLDEERISLGRAPRNTICLTALKLISLDHLVIERAGPEALLRVEGANGCYLNGYYVKRGEKRRLCFSDELILHGLKLIWLKDSLVLINYCGKERIEANGELSLIRLRKTGLCGDCPDGDLYMPPGTTRDEAPALHDCSGLGEDEALCGEAHPIPRTVKRLDRTPVELDAPPHKQEQREESLLLTIGPAFTMAIPMALGSGLAIYGNRHEASGGGGAFMYTGLITAVSAAFLGALWAVLNLRKRRKEERKRERRRKKAYERYIKGIEEQIRQKYSYNREALLYMYPPPDKLLVSFDRNYLWNRLREDEDYLYVRLGTGEYPKDAVNVEIPKERFTIENDALSSLPMLLKTRYGSLRDAPALLDLSEAGLFGVIAGNWAELEKLFFLIMMQLCFFISAQKLRIAVFLTKGSLPETRVRQLRFLPHLKGLRHYGLCFENACLNSVRESLRELIASDAAEGIARDYVVFCDDYEGVKALRKESESLKIILFALSFNSLPGECCRIVRNDESFKGIMNTRDSGDALKVRYDELDLLAFERFARKLSGVNMSEEGIRLPIPQRVLMEQIFETPMEDMGAFIAECWLRNDAVKSLRIPIGIGSDGKIICLDPHESFHGPHGLVAGMTGSGKSEVLQTLILSLAMCFSPQRAAFFLIDYKGGGMAELFKDLPHLSGSISNLSGNNIFRAMVSIRSENERRQKLFLEAGVNRIAEYERKRIKGEVREPLPHIFIIIDEFAELKKNEPEFMRELVSVAQVGRSLGIHLFLATQKPQGTVDDNIWSNSRFRICLRVQDKQDSSDMLHKPDAAFLKEAGRAFLQVGNDEVYEEFQSAYTMALRGKEGGEQRLALLDRKGERIKERAPDAAPKSREPKVTDFDVIKKLIVLTADTLKIPNAKKLWMRELPKELEVDRNLETEDYTYCLGMYDAPRRQKQGGFLLSLLAGGHHLVLGRSGSGKSTFLETLIYEFLIHENPHTMNVYVIDFSNGLLSGYSESLLLGACLTEEDIPRIDSLFYMLKKEMARRRADFKGINFAMKRELKEAIGAKVLVIDNYGAFRQKTGEKHDEEIQELLKNGEAYGIYLILTGNRIGPSDIPSKVHEIIRSVVCLSMNDRMDYSQSLRVLHCETYPDEGVPGRGIGFNGTELLEFQTGLSFLGNDYERRLCIGELISGLNVGYAGARAKQVPFIPRKPVLSDLLGTVSEDQALISEAQNGSLPIGYMVKSGEALMMPFCKMGCFIVSGRKKSGKSNLIRVIEETASFYGRSSVRLSELSELKPLLSTGDSKKLIILEDLAAALEEFYLRKYDRILEEELILLIERNRNEPGCCMIFECGREGYSMMAGRKIFEALKEEACGIHLGGMINDQSLFEFSELSFSQKSQSKKAGEGNVPFVTDGLFFGEARIPLWEETVIMNNA